MSAPGTDPGTIIYAKDWLTFAALLFGPLLAVYWTFQHQDRSQKRNAKERLFMTLMAHRKSNPPTADWANSLNLIDVVFSDEPKVVGLWQALYTILVTKPWNQERYTHGYLELLSHMAKSLGYEALTQTDIDKFYTPEAHGTTAAKQEEVQKQFLRVLKHSRSFSADRPQAEIQAEEKDAKK